MSKGMGMKFQTQFKKWIQVLPLNPLHESILTSQILRGVVS